MKYKRILNWTIQNILQITAAYFAVVAHIVWAERILTFWGVLQLIVAIAILIAANSDSAKNIELIKKARVEGPSVPISVNWAFDFITALLCAAAGWYFLAACFLLVGIANSTLYDPAKIKEARLDLIKE